MPSQIELYEEMSQLSSRMVEAARANNWDNLIELERGVAALRDTLMTNPDFEDDLKIEGSDKARTAMDIARKRLLIQRILDDDAEVRRHTEPWMEQVRNYLGFRNQRRDVQKAYGVGSLSAGGFST
ncbi:MAG TPA: flagellar protein FliT [Rhodocyclaceae bacterium]|nr:flagellar protein FliT [Rhodocyclaceae bacterium]